MIFKYSEYKANPEIKVNRSNYTDHHDTKQTELAHCELGITFKAAPHQDFYGYLDSSRYYARVSKRVSVWNPATQSMFSFFNADIISNDGQGSTSIVQRERFENQDDAFIFASEYLGNTPK
jgi:hypothetical protein